jgi:NAD(P)-dependent dehydrogenase (short-subunit alcohol dehydrogenase family)
MEVGMDLSGVTALVTGAASGIGRATAVRFAELGASNVACLDVHDKGNAETAELVEKAGARALDVHIELSDVSQIRHAYAAVMNGFGRIDAAAHVGGFTWRQSTVSVSESDWDNVVDVNLRGTFFCSQEALKVMYEQHSGAIVNISATPAFTPVSDYAVQAAAKGGIVAMSRVLAIEAAPYGVRVNTVTPGPVQVVKTGQAAPRPTEGKAPEELIRVSMGSVATRYAIGRSLTPVEVADTIIFLTSSLASGINGDNVFVDGGGYAN